MPDVSFAALPARVFGDDRLKLLHWKIIGAVALHDRLSGARGKGRGCTANNPTLAAKIRCNLTNLSTAIGQLVSWGYLESEVDPVKRRNRTLRVVYTDEDAAFMGSSENLPVRKHFPAEDSEEICPETNELGEKVCLETTQHDKIVCLSFEKDQRNQQSTLHNIFRETGRYSVETGTNAVETGRDTRERARLSPRELIKRAELKHGTGGLLAMFERAFDEDPAAMEIEAWHDWLFSVQETQEGDDQALFHWAERLLEKVDFVQHVLSLVRQPDGIGDTDLVQTWWRCGGAAGRRALCASHGMTLGELMRFAEGSSNLPAPKISAMARTVRRILNQSPRQQAAS